MDFLKNIYLVAPYKNPFLVALDIAIVSLFVYKIILMLHRTRGVQLITVIIGIWTIGTIAEKFDLELLDFIITNIRSALVFAIIVLLQPELRRAAGGLIQWKIFSPFFSEGLFNIEPVLDAVKQLSLSKTGSIIAFVRNHDLRDIIETAVQVDGIVTSSLLLAIFHKNSPLHDGAVIIEKNRIITAASYLPISTNVDQSTMGARHRSALGLSESSDAVVIVTSEETGGISLFFNGDQIKVSSIQELREKLQALIKTKSTGNKK